MNVDQVIGAFTAASTRREELKRMQKTRPGGVGGAARRGVLATDRVVGGVLKGLKDRLQDKMLGALPEESPAPEPASSARRKSPAKAAPARRAPAPAPARRKPAAAPAPAKARTAAPAKARSRGSKKPGT